MTDLEALKSSDFETLQNAYRSLKEDVYRICFKFLQRKFPLELEDVASEAAADILEQVDNVRDSKGLADLTKSIAENQAINRYVKLTAKKRREDLKESLDATKTDDEGEENLIHKPAAEPPHLDQLDVKDIRNIIETLQTELKSEHKQALNDYFIGQKSFEQISQERGWPIGSVGVYVKRGVEAMRKQRLKYPALAKEAMQYIVSMLA
jgi:RNA polymerase sigma factor (sigma-70 family)